MSFGRVKFSIPFFLIAYLGVVTWANAQVVPPSEDASRLRERFTPPPGPRAQPDGARIQLPASVAPEQANQISIQVDRISIEGSTVYAPAELDELTTALSGRTVSLQSVYDLANSITAKYGRDGYVLSRAIVPPQEFSRQGATVHIKIIEGYIDHVQWPDGVQKFRDLFSYYSAQIKNSRPINIKVIERYLLLANDLPGLSFRSTLQPSDLNTGAATLVLEMTEKPVFGQGRIDNRGTRGRGPYQYVLTGGTANVLGQHESVAITYASVFDPREVQYVAGDFRTVLNGEGLTYLLSPYYSAGRPGTDLLKAIGYQSEALGVETGASFPLIRSREQNLTVYGLAFATDSVGNVSAGPLSDDRLRGLRLRANYDVADGWNGINQITATFSQGANGLGSTSNGNPLASRTAGRVDFSKFDAYASRLQPIGLGFSLFGAVEGQYALSALLVSEQCSYGGSRIGRAFDPSALVGDRCISELLELRYDVATAIPKISQAQLYGFADHGDVTLVDAAASSPSHLTGASVGGGVRLAWDANFFGTAEVAKHVQGVDPNGWRAFFSLTARY